MVATTHVEVSHDDLPRTRTVTGESGDPGPGEALLRVERFALTANNVSYALFGERMRYWDFFPADEGWGRVPVWGFAEVVASSVEEVAPGQRYWGYYPMGSHLTVRAEPDRTGFEDVAAHRAELPAAYNRYLRTDLDRGHDPAHEEAQMVMRPLFITSYLLDDVLAADGYGGARTVLVSSASSRTGYAFAFAVARRSDERPELVGLTSPGNVEFTERLGFYDRVLSYEALGELDADAPMAYADFAGSLPLREKIHDRFGDKLVRSTVIGASHHDELAFEGGADVPGPRPTFFFAPTHLAGRGPDFFTSLSEAWREFVGPFEAAVAFDERRGSEAVRQAWAEVVAGDADPRLALILSVAD